MSSFRNTIFVVNDIDLAIEELVAKLPKHSVRIIRNQDTQKDEFQLNEANLAIKEAYLASSSEKYLLLCGKVFRTEAQNSLLKILEESPPNCVFFMITESKVAILPTIFSRMNVKYIKKNNQKSPSELEINIIDMSQIYDFLKKNQRISKLEAKDFVQNLCIQVMKSNIQLSSKELELFSKSIKLLELNSKPSGVLTTLLMSLVFRKKTS